MKKITMLILCLFIASCGWINSEGLTKANEICEKHGGIKEISPMTANTSYFSYVVYRDESRFKIF